MKKLMKLALIIGAIAVLAKLVAGKKAKWQNLTESEPREPSMPAPTETGRGGEEPDSDNATTNEDSDKNTAPI